MNGYDFDNTILRGNSTRRFACFCTVRLPYLILFVPVILIACILRALHIISMNKYLHMLEWFIALVPKVDKFVAKFWDKNMKHIKSWYLAQRRDDDIVISASPYFLVVEACKRLGVACIATNLDKCARLNGHKHVYGRVKVTTYQIIFESNPLASYYSDSMSDTPMFQFAQKGYFVKGDKILQLYENGEQILPFRYKKRKVITHMDILNANGYYNLSSELQRKFLMCQNSKEGIQLSLEEFYEIFSVTTFGWDFEYDGHDYWMMHSKDGYEICCEDEDNSFWKGFSTAQELFECQCISGKCLKEIYCDVKWL